MGGTQVYTGIPTVFTQPSFSMQVDHELFSVILAQPITKSTFCAFMAALLFLLLIGAVYVFLVKIDFHADEYAEALMGSKTPGRTFRRTMFPITIGLVVVLAASSIQMEGSLKENVIHALSYSRSLGIYTLLFLLWMVHRTRMIVRRKADDTELAKDAPVEKPPLLAEDAKPEIFLTNDRIQCYSL